MMNCEILKIFDFFPTAGTPGFNFDPSEDL